MQTFLPLPDFYASAKVLDRQRLGKQRLEAWQILNTLLGESKGWANHPAVKMWRGYEIALCWYGMAMSSHWHLRGYKDNMHARFEEVCDVLESDSAFEEGYPWWLNEPALHASHRSNLLRKAPEWYNQFGWTEPDSLPYVWPEA